MFLAMSGTLRLPAWVAMRSLGAYYSSWIPSTDLGPSLPCSLMIDLATIRFVTRLHSSKLLFLAEYSKGEEAVQAVIVKFARTYGLQAHEAAGEGAQTACANAPRWVGSKSS
jgi:hypothetical protein